MDLGRVNRNEVYIQIKRSDGKEFSINRGDYPDWKIPSNGLEGFGNYDNSINTTNNAIGDGAIITSTRIAQKDRTIKAKSRNPQMNEVLRREATAFFSPKYDYAVYLTYMGKTRWFEGKIHKFMLPTRNTAKAMEMTLVFLSADPYLKSYDDFGQNIASVKGRVAFPYISAVGNNYPRIMKGITGGQFNFAQKIILENDGDVDAYCRAIFEAVGSVKNPKLVINNHYVRVIDNLEDGDVIEMDFTKNPPRVTKNGKNFVGHCDRTSAFDEMALGIGDTEVSFDADNGSNLLRVSIYYNKLYASM